MTANVYGQVFGEAVLNPTPVKTGAYTASPSDLVPCDISGGSFTVTLPNAPGNGSRVAVKIINTNAAATNLLTVACQGSDRINTAGGNVSFTVQLLNQGVTLQYNAATGIWYITDDSLPLSGLRNLMPDWINVKAYGATGGGSIDDTTAIQNALNAAAASSAPAVVYFPGGDYLISAPLTYSASFPLAMVGDTTAGHLGRKAGASTIHMNFAPGHALSISSTPYFRLADIDIAVDGTNSGGPTADYSGIYTTGVNNVIIERCQVYKNNGNFSVNSPIRMINALYAIIRQCFVTGEQSGIWQDGGAGITIEDTQITTTIGNGFGAVRMDNTLGTGAATIQLSNVTTFRGDWGFCAFGSGNSAPFIYMNNVQMNNPRKGGIYLQCGSGFWGDYVWISMSGVPFGTANTTGIYIDTQYQGGFYLFNSVIQSPSNHGMYIAAGQGFILSGVQFGICGNATANTWDDLHIAAAAKNITVSGCHFDTDKFMGLGSPVARSAVYIESGATSVNVHDNQFATSGYGTGAVVNLAASASVRFHGNIGYNPVGLLLASAPAVAASGTAVTNTTGVDCMVIVTVSGSGGLTSVSIGGNVTGVASSTASAVLPPVRVPAGQTITLSYTNAPTWSWFGD